MKRKWICLLYHDVAPTCRPWSGGPERFTVTTRDFREQLDCIRHLGLSGCSIERAAGADDSRRPIAISFDDGTAGQYKEAFPLLRARGMTATFFVVTDWIGRAGYMTWEQLEEMKTAGMSIQSHTRTHPFLSELSASQLRAELGGSKQELDRRLGQVTHSVALPGGDYPDGRLRHLFAEAGFRLVATSRWGANRTVESDLVKARPAVFVRRCPIRGRLSPARFARVATGHPWAGARRLARDAPLRTVRRAIGVGRYARLRRSVLGAVARLVDQEPV